MRTLAHRVPAKSLGVAGACLVSAAVGSGLAVLPLAGLPLAALAWIGFAWLGFRMGQASPASWWFVGPAAVVPAGVFARLLLQGPPGPIDRVMDGIFFLVLAHLVISGCLATAGAWMGASFEPNDRRVSVGLGKRFRRRIPNSEETT